MNLKIVIRSETDADVSAITTVTVAAFKTLELSNSQLGRMQIGASWAEVLR